MTPPISSVTTTSASTKGESAMDHTTAETGAMKTTAVSLCGDGGFARLTLYKGKYRVCFAKKNHILFYCKAL